MLRSSPARAQQRYDTCQAVVVTDPVLATAVLRSKDLDKLRFQYSFLDPVQCTACHFAAHAPFYVQT